MGLLGRRVATGLTALAVTWASAGAAHAAAPALQQKYVALGDSFTSSPMTGMPVGEPVGCSRTQNNYPRQVAAALRVSDFVDVSCGSATTRDLFAAQNVLGGSNAPQLDAVDATTTLVTLGIGGNDLGLMGWLQRCADLASPNCMDQWAPGGPDVLVQRIAKIAVNVDRALQVIHHRAPQARVLLVGYPVVAPVAGVGCLPQLPIDESDLAYLRDLQQRLNAMLARVAYFGGATYVDTYTPSIGHDPCQLDDAKWIEGMIPDQPAAALHPNLSGQNSFAHEVLAQLGISRS
ncbi:MAG TPA: SGNH/GDSL hydrolase family protein [Sporichthyaceae bacterium]|jgi:lysophospholipase L1-like esterase